MNLPGISHSKPLCPERVGTASSEAASNPAPPGRLDEPLPWTVSEQFIKCGKPACRCRTGRLHDPYYYRIWRGEGRTVHKVYVKVYVKAADLAQVRAQCARHVAITEELRALRVRAEALTACLQRQVTRSRKLRAALALACSDVSGRRRKHGEGANRMTQHERLNPEFDDVYAAIANAIRYAGGAGASPAKKVPMTKSRVAAVHRKMLAGEPLDAGQEQDIAGRLRRQLGLEHRPRAGAAMTGGDVAGGSGTEQGGTEQGEIDREVSRTEEALRVAEVLRVAADREEQVGPTEAGRHGLSAWKEVSDEPTAPGLGAPAPAQSEKLRVRRGDNLAAARPPQGRRQCHLLVAGADGAGAGTAPSGGRAARRPGAHRPPGGRRGPLRQPRAPGPAPGAGGG